MSDRWHIDPELLAKAQAKVSRARSRPKAKADYFARQRARAESNARVYGRLRPAQSAPGLCGTSPTEPATKGPQSPPGAVSTIFGATALDEPRDE
jgi:hypothetical protein